MSEDKQTRISARQVQEELTQKLDKVVDSTNDAIEAVNEKVDGMSSKIDQVLNAIQSPAVIRNHFEADEQELGHAPVAEFSEKDDEAIIEAGHFGDINQPEFKDKAKELAFMEEKVKIHVHDTSERNADKVFDISVNGKTVTFIRGNEYIVARKFVEGLARAKPVHFDNQEYTKTDGTQSVRYPARRGLRYSFSVIEDRNPRGKEWLKGVIAQP